MDAAERSRLCTAWLAFARTGDDADAWAWERMGELQDDPAALAEVVRALVAAVPEGDALGLAFVAGGPLDVLLDVAPAPVVERLAADAAHDPRLRDALRETARSRAVRAASDTIRAAASDEAEVVWPPRPSPSSAKKA